MQKVALITGGAKRVGAAIARRLHASGFQLMIHYRSSASEARTLQAVLNADRPGSVALVQADLLNLDGLNSLVDETVRVFGRLDVLVNNASSFSPTPVGEITKKDWDDLIGSNLLAPLFLSQAAMPQLRANHGCIVNIVDIHADRPMKNYVVYSTAKAGLANLTRSLARELAPEVRVNGVAPGPVLRPDDMDGVIWDQAILERIPLRREGDPTDVASCVLYLATTGSYVNGQVIAVDGGRNLGF